MEEGVWSWKHQLTDHGNFNRLDETSNDPHGESGLLKQERIKLGT